MLLALTRDGGGGCSDSSMIVFSLTGGGGRAGACLKVCPGCMEARCGVVSTSVLLL